MRARFLVILLGFLFALFLSDFGPFDVGCSDVHDIAVIRFYIFPGQDEIVHLKIPLNANVTVENQGTADESFNVTLYFGNATADTVHVTDLQAGSRANVTFGWNIFPHRLIIFPPPWDDPMKPIHKNVTIKVEADVVPGETDTSDNLLIDGTIHTVWMVPDINGDGIHDMRDIGAVARYFGSQHILMDFNSDGRVDMRDIGTSARVFGTSY